jgi:hypothetical protein
LSLLLAVGCGPSVVVDGHKLDQRSYETELARVKARAKFDFDCPAEKLATTVVTTYGENVVQQFGVSGCDHRAIYVLSASGWVLNATDGRTDRATDSH